MLLLVRAPVPYSPSDVWLIRRREREEEEAGGRMVGLRRPSRRRGRRWRCKFGQPTKEGKGGKTGREKAKVGWGPKTERGGLHRRVICEARSCTLFTRISSDDRIFIS